jgi:hypothetical protein
MYCSVCAMLFLSVDGLCYDRVIAICNYFTMEALENNVASEDFGKLPNDSEGFGNVPNRLERKENHVLTVHSVARMFEDAGVARTERSVTNWCQPDKNGVAKLDCFFDQNERKYYISPQSVERAIEEEKSKIISGELPHVSETGGNVPKASETFRTVPNTSESKAPEQPTHQQNESANLSPDLIKELESLRVERRVWETEKKFHETWIKKLESEREAFVPQIAELSKSAGYFEAKAELLEKENQRLLIAPVQNKARIIEPESTDNADHEEEPVGEGTPQETLAY